MSTLSKLGLLFYHRRNCRILPPQMKQMKFKKNGDPNNVTKSKVILNIVTFVKSRYLIY